MSLKDLKMPPPPASRKQTPNPRTASCAHFPVAVPAVEEGPATAQVVDGRTKMLGARVPLSIHREWQGHVFRAQDQYRV